MAQNVKNNRKAGSILTIGVLFLIGLIIRLLYYTALDKILIYPDSSEYLVTADRLDHFRLHSSRVPVYPLFISIARTILPFFDTVTSVIVMQSIVSAAAFVLLYIAAKKIFKRTRKAILLFLFCTTSVCLLNWDFLILTESITNVFIIMLIVCSVAYVHKSKDVYLILLYGICLLMMFTKPFFMLLPVIISAVALIRGMLYGNWKRTAFITVASMILIYSSVLGYSYVNFKQNGYFGISNVSVINKFGKILQYGMYEYGENEVITNDIRKYIAQNGGETPVPVAFIAEHKLTDNNYSEISEYVSNIIKKHPIIFVEKTLKLIAYDVCKQKVFIDYNHVYSNNNYINKWPIRLFKITNDIRHFNSFMFIFIILIIEMTRLSAEVIRKRNFEWIWIIIVLLIAYQLGMSIIGSHGEYHRLMSPAYIPVFLITFKYIFAIANFINSTLLGFKKLDV